MMLHIDGSDHHWFSDERRQHELIVISGTMPPARFTTRSWWKPRVDIYGDGGLAGGGGDEGCFPARCLQRSGRSFFCDAEARRARGPKPADASGESDAGAFDQGDPGLLRPQAQCGRMERSYGTRQGRLPQELRLRGIKDLDRANAVFAEPIHAAEFNHQFAVPAAQKRLRLCPLETERPGLDFQRSARAHGEPGQYPSSLSRVFQLEHTRWRNALAGQTVVVHEHLDGRVSIR